MTIAEFVERKFVPEHVASKRTSGRTHYQAILKHVLTPEEVDRVFHTEQKKRKTILKAIPDWPYLGSLPLHDARPEQIQRLISAGIERGYSTQTVTHFRNVVSSIFTHARKERLFEGANPASLVKLPEITRSPARPLTLAQAEEVLRAMRFPEREMTLFAILTGMNVAEICGLQWKYVNLSGNIVHSEGEYLAPRTIAVRKQWYRCALGSIKRSRERNLKIPEPLFLLLLKLSQRAKFTSPDDFVLISRAGTPINQANIVSRRLRPIGRQLQMPWLSWHVILRTHTAFASEFKTQFHVRMAELVDAVSWKSAGIPG